MTFYYINTENLEKESESSNTRMRKISALIRTFRDPEYYDEQFPAFSQRKKILHETEEGVTEVGKEMQLIIDEQAERVREEETVNNLQSIKETLNLTTQQAMDAMRIPSEKQSRYARMV